MQLNYIFFKYNLIYIFFFSRAELQCFKKILNEFSDLQIIILNLYAY